MKRLKVLSLAALVAFAACDEGSEPIVEPTPTGTISGVVTIEGTARSGVTVTLSSGATATTDGSGAYSFAGVTAGAYTVSITGFPSDATFSSTAKAATITTAGQVVTVNFDGTYVRTSAVLGSVTAGGKGLAGVKVTLGTSSVNTDANGQYAFSGLRAGSYTVTISGFDAGQYTFASTSSNVTVGVGESKVVSFSGQLLATARISGTVTIDGTAAAGVTATLSTGAVATTDASGAYAFSNLTAGNYTVTISGYPADAQFESVAKPVVITSAGSTVTANFSGAFIKTSTIVGQVTVAGNGVAGVTVTLSGGTTVNTNASGQYSFAALRAGTYTVTISGWDASLYTFATTTGTVTVATGQSAVQNFTGAHVATAMITGSLYLDEAASNGTFDSTEDKLKVAGIVIQAEGGAVNNTFTTTTDANGDYKFENLVAGTYRLTIMGVTAAPLNAALPGNVAFRATAPTSQLVTVGVGASGMAHWPFNITRQSIHQYVMFGVEGSSVGTNPVAGASVWLYDTYNNAVGAAAAGRIGTATTTSTGMASFNFARAVDVGPGGSVDNIVFARLNTLPNANYALSNAENVIEIKYNPKDSVSMAPDTMDVINNQVIVKVKTQEIDNDALAGWTTQARFAPDTTTAALVATSAASGWVHYTINRTVITNHVAGNLTFPDTITIRLQDTGQPATHPYTSTATAGAMGSTTGRFVRYIWNGLTAASDTIDMGSLNVKYTTSDVVVRAHRERDDSGGAKPTYTAGDDFAVIGSINMQIYSIAANGTKTAVGGAVAAGPNGGVLFVNLPNGNYEVRARSTDPTLTVLNDTVVAVTLDGSDEVYTDRTLQGSTSAFNSTFAVKSNNNFVNGTVLGSNGTTPATGLIVTITPDAGNIQGTAMKIDTTDANGAYGFSGLREGPYTVTIAGSAGVWEFTKTLTTTSAPNASGSANNTSPTVAPRDVQGTGFTLTANFEPRRMDTKIQGLIANDRDGDQNTIDPEEGLYAASVQLYKDNSGTITVNADSLVATTTTDVNGAFVFSGLAEGTYIVKPVATANSVVLRGLTNGDTAIVRTGPAYTSTATVACPSLSVANGNPDASLNTACHGRTVGITSGFSAALPLPAWNYGNSTFNLKQSLAVHRQPHFTFLFNTGTATGVVTKATVAVAGMTVSAVKCQTSTGFTSPPTVTNPMTGTCTPVGSPFNAVTDATGKFTISGLQEGVWMVTANPATAGLADPTWSALFQILGNNDIETGNFPIP